LSRLWLGRSLRGLVFIEVVAERAHKHWLEPGRVWRSKGLDAHQFFPVFRRELTYLRNVEDI
jgi:hypothetical protein